MISSPAELDRALTERGRTLREGWDAGFDVVVLPEPLTYYHQRPHVTSTSEANSLFGEIDAHKFYESKLINHHSHTLALECHLFQLVVQTSALIGN